jgi:hypothetical protein
MKRCPYCAEAIQDDAVVCPLCHTNLAVNVYTPPQALPGTRPIQPMMAGDPYPQQMGAQPQASGKATASLICGICGYVILPIIATIPAIILGHMALSEIKKSAGRLTGQGLAMAGLILGYIQVALFPFFILIIAAIAIPNLLKSRMAANEATAVGSLRTITTAEISYSTACPKIGFAYSLTELGPSASACPEGGNQIDQVLASGTKSGYRFIPRTFNFSGQVPEDTFGWNADPISNATGTRHFFVDQTGVIRYSTTGQADENSTPLR